MNRGWMIGGALLLLVAVVAAVVALGGLGGPTEGEAARVARPSAEAEERVEAPLRELPQETAEPADERLAEIARASQAGGQAQPAPASAEPAPDAPVVVQVVDSGGTPIEDADVAATDWLEALGASLAVAASSVARTDEEGRVELDARLVAGGWAFGHVQLFVRAEGFAPQEVLAQVENGVARVVLLRWASLIVSGRTEAEQGIVDVDVQLDARAIESDAGWFTTADGKRANDRVRPGERLVRIAWTAPGGARHHSEVAAFELAEAETRELVLALHPPAFVTGRLDARVPRPVADGVVELRSGRAGSSPFFDEEPELVHAWHVAVREDGTFDVGDLPRGPVHVAAVCAGWTSLDAPGAVAQLDGERDVAEPLLGGTHELVVGMERAARAVVRLRNPSGQPLADARVELFVSMRPRFVDREYVATTGFDGTVAFDDVPVRAASLVVEHPTLRGVAEDVELASGETTSLAFTLEER